MIILKLAKSCHCVVMHQFIGININNYIGAEVGLSGVDLVLGELTKI